MINCCSRSFGAAILTLVPLDGWLRLKDYRAANRNSRSGAVISVGQGPCGKTCQWNCTECSLRGGLSITTTRVSLVQMTGAVFNVLVLSFSACSGTMLKYKYLAGVSFGIFAVFREMATG